MKYVILVRYLGTDFCGFQVQPGLRTVQGELNRAAEALFGCPCAVTGCSRTDSGVHAEMFAALLAPSSEEAPLVPCDRLPRAIAAHLPPDLSVLWAGEAQEDFHPRYGILEKEYRYDILNAPVRDPFLVGRVWHYPRPITAEMLSAMERAAQAFVGTHDFASFMAEGSSVTDTVRTVSSVSLARTGNLISFRVRGDGFLYHMVRIMVGTLIEVAEGKLTAADIPAILAAKDRRAAGMTAPPDGLYLARLFYPDGVLPTSF